MLRLRTLLEGSMQPWKVVKAVGRVTRDQFTAKFYNAHGVVVVQRWDTAGKEPREVERD